jgi:hypothetical protein
MHYGGGSDIFLSNFKRHFYSLNGKEFLNKSCCYFQISLFMNNGDGTFKEKTIEMGLGEARGWSHASCFADFNLDG